MAGFSTGVEWMVSIMLGDLRALRGYVRSIRSNPAYSAWYSNSLHLFAKPRHIVVVPGAHRRSHRLVRRCPLLSTATVGIRESCVSRVPCGGIGCDNLVV